MAAEQMLVHDVYFTLKDASTAAQQALVDACYKYLKDHPGVVFFAAGTLEPELARPVNVRDFHVGLHVVFESRKAHDEYQTAEDHVTFINENRDSWAQVRVYDTLCPR